MTRTCPRMLGVEGTRKQSERSKGSWSRWMRNYQRRQEGGRRQALGVQAPSLKHIFSYSIGFHLQSSNSKRKSLRIWKWKLQDLKPQVQRLFWAWGPVQLHWEYCHEVLVLDSVLGDILLTKKRTKITLTSMKFILYWSDLQQNQYISNQLEDGKFYEEK